MVLNYCDDQIWPSPTNEVIEKYVKKLHGLGYDLSIENKGDNIYDLTIANKGENICPAVGILLYLSFNTCPDVQFTVHQVARLSHCPKQSHAQAIQLIVRYQLMTGTCGTLIKHDLSKGLDCFVEAWKEKTSPV